VLKDLLVSIDINGESLQGIGGAHVALALQLPFLVSRFPVLAGCHPGTLNIQLDQPLRVANPNFVSPPIRWHPQHQPPEIFSFIEVSLDLPLGSSRGRAWICIPFHSPHFHNVYQVELIAPFIADLAATAVGTRCCIHIPKPHTTRALIII